MTTNYLQLNNLFPSDMDIIAVKKYKRTGVFPVSADTDRKRNAFKTKYQFFDMSKDGQHLMYTNEFASRPQGKQKPNSYQRIQEQFWKRFTQFL